MLSAVQLTTDSFLACLSYALTTEKEEVMGLLLGDISQNNDGSLVSTIVGISILERSDKRKDRVEISPEQLTCASKEAEILSQDLGYNIRVIGWFHSHPHITVLPSHVDVRTQASYQMLDPGFIGLIFSCFNNDESSNRGRIEVIAFQSMEINQNNNNNNKNNSYMQDVIQTKFEQIDVPLNIVRTPIISPRLLEKIASIQDILYDEEKRAYDSSIGINDNEENENNNNGQSNIINNMHPLELVHNSAVYEKALCRLLEYGCSPLFTYFNQRIHKNINLIENLKLQKKLLEQAIEKESVEI